MLRIFIAFAWLVNLAASGSRWFGYFGQFMSIPCTGDRVRLADVSVLTLRQGAMTTGRRSSPVPQIKCVGGTASGRFSPVTVQCYNRGFDGSDYQVQSRRVEAMTATMCSGSARLTWTTRIGSARLPSPAKATTIPTTRSYCKDRAGCVYLQVAVFE